MKLKSAFLLCIFLLLACGEKSGSPDLTPLSLTAIGASAASENQDSVRILSPKEGEIVTVYQLEATIQADQAGEYEVYHEGQRIASGKADASTPQTTPVFKPKNGENTIQVRFKKSDGTILQKEVRVHFGTKLSAGAAHSGFLKNGELYTVGRNNFGQLGTGTSTGDGINDVVTKLTSITDISSIHFNQNSSMAITKNGKVYTWGTNANGQLGIGNNTTDPASASTAGPRQPPTEVPGITNAVMGAYGFDHALVLKSDGTIVAFGLNGLGQLGNGATGLTSTTISTNPVPVVGLTDVIQVVAGSQHSAALTSSGEVYVWGRSQYGNLGNGVIGTSTAAQSTPLKVAGLSGIKQIANGRDHILALKSDGKVYSWGLNASGQLGIGGTGSPSPTPTPTQVLNILNAVSVWAGGTQSFAILKDGTVKGWGANSTTANLGIGETTTAKVYEPNNAVVGISGLTHFGCGATHNFALLGSGAIYGWGWNFKGSLGRPDLQTNWGAATPVYITLP
ncbi:chromosome condensation regulator [Leptospira yasudae]|uniref:RCC1 domain-containing protein n=1 Tax=Leptospira yasudae TaxID=2202201 RepID=UPI001082EC6F|nr:chromosome condensation regulator [Leptospira yasudae]TGK24665.1 chromosome condensation regulator [Leptospira yasudae]TGM09450.1 chromosome condensation regulator [Leptospira yasudae]